MDYEKLTQLAVELAYRKGQRTALSNTMTRIYDSRFDQSKTEEARQAVSEIWFSMQKEYLEHDAWVKATEKAFTAIGFNG